MDDERTGDKRKRDREQGPGKKQRQPHQVLKKVIKKSVIPMDPRLVKLQRIKSVNPQLTSMIRTLWSKENRDLPEVAQLLAKSEAEILQKMLETTPDELSRQIKILHRPTIDFDAERTSQYTIIFRFADESEFTPIESLWKMNCYNYQHIDKDTGNQLDVHKMIFATPTDQTDVGTIIYHLNSSQRAQKLISARTYLSPGHGVGGQYVGFNEYTDDTSNLFHWPHLSNVYNIFQGQSRYCIFTFLEPILQRYQSVLDCNSGEYNLSTGTGVNLDSVIPVQPGVLWYGRLGSLMDPPNMAEHNFVGDLNIPAFVIDSHDPKCIKSVLSAAYHGFFDEAIPACS